MVCSLSIESKVLCGFALVLDGESKEGHKHSVQVCILLHLEQGNLPRPVPVR